MSQLIVSAKETNLRLSVVSLEQYRSKTAQVSLEINPSVKYQSILGFGGAFTESACYNLYRVGKKAREEAMKAYFDPIEGIGYNLGRVSIHGCDFSLSSYTYIEEGDSELKTFNIARDFQYVIPVIKEAEAISGQVMQLLASPWTPPPFMKDNKSFIRGGHLLPEFAPAWANYYLRFIQEYRKAGLHIWGITVQNEPAAVQRWDSCIYSAEEEGNFIKNHLGPVIKNSEAKDVNILIWDHNRDIIVERVTPILSDPETAKYVWGTGFHWYVSNAFENVGKVHELFPDKGLLFTEGCIEGGVKMDDWNSGERYATQMIGDLSNHCQGYIDWNLFLDNLGGPNHVNNLCDAPILLDIFPEKVIRQSSYFYIGHISKFVKPGAKRIHSSLNNHQISAIAFENPNGEIVSVLMNKSKEAISVEIKHSGKQEVISLLPRSIATLIQ
ncbi:MAG: glycoside hydrolase family 30 protein [Candidatus Izemoplasmatales bacterium]|nr:glycoside hydrolase family 30 protein [bacterium]MDZ4195990.1 glycoside hydrolase family 30 protein [Candidatus Izemoplasmatales bacterium]